MKRDSDYTYVFYLHVFIVLCPCSFLFLGILHAMLSYLVQSCQCLHAMFLYSSIMPMSPCMFLYLVQSCQFLHAMVLYLVQSCQCHTVFIQLPFSNNDFPTTQKLHTLAIFPYFSGHIFTSNAAYCSTSKT